MSHGIPAARAERRYAPLRIIALAPNCWHDQWMNRQYLLSRLGRRHRILYSTGPRASWDRSSEAFREASLTGEFEVRDNVIVDHPGKCVLRVPAMPPVDRLFMRIAAKRWRSQLGSTGGPLLLWLFHPLYEPYVNFIKPDLLVYHAYDLFSETKGWSARLAAAESRLVREADLVIASSQVTAEHLDSLGGRRAHFLPNGVEFDRFVAADCCGAPQDLACVPRPRIAYIGSVNPKFDLELMLELVVRRTDWQWVIVGHTVALTESDMKKWRDLTAKPNVHVLGHKSNDCIAAYAAGMDVSLLAYRTEGAWTRGIYPIRLHEHLAAGLPIISADFPAVREFSDVVWRASGPDDWIDKIGRALAGEGPGTTAERRAVAKANTWDSRVEQLESLLGQLVTE